MAISFGDSSWGMQAFRVEGEWWRGPASLAGDEDEQVIEWADIDRVEPYSWLIAGRLPYDLAAIRHETDVLGFVRKWGLLREDDDDDHDPFSIEDFLSESLEMNYLLYLYGLIRPPRAGPEAQRALVEYWVGVYSGLVHSDRARWLADPERGRQLDPTDLAKVAKRADFDEMQIDVREVLEEDVREQLHEIPLSLSSLDFFEEAVPGEAPPPGEFVLTAWPRDLLARSYIELAREMTAGVRVAQCPEDGRIFPVRDPRQIYCSTQCAGRARFRRFAKRSRSKATRSEDR
jgi:hypothetical protein